MELADFIQSTMVGFIIIITPVIVGLTQVIKKSLNLRTTRYVPLVSLLLGVALGVVFGKFASTQYNVLAGIVAGLSACGLYSGTKTLATRQ